MVGPTAAHVLSKTQITNMRRLLLPLTALATTGLLWSQVSPAHACLCPPQTVAQRVPNYSHVVVGTVNGLIEDRRVESVKRALVSVERYFKGSGANEIIAAEQSPGSDCTFFDEASVGRRYVLFLSNNSITGSSNEDGELYTHLCSGNEIASEVSLAQVRAVTGPGIPSDSESTPGAPADEEPSPGATSDEQTGSEPTAPADGPESNAAPSGSGFPSVPAAIAATLAPLAFLAGAAFVWRRKGGAR